MSVCLSVGGNTVARWLHTGCKWPAYRFAVAYSMEPIFLVTKPDREGDSSISSSGFSSEFGVRNSLTLSNIFLQAGSYVQVDSSTFLESRCNSSAVVFPTRMFAMSDLANSLFRILELFSPRFRTQSVSSFCARSVKRFLGIPNFFSMSSRLKLSNSNRWSSNSTTGIHSIVSTFGSSFTSGNSGIIALINSKILLKLKMMTNDQMNFGKK